MVEILVEQGFQTFTSLGNIYTNDERLAIDAIFCRRGGYRAAPAVILSRVKVLFFGQSS